MQSKSNNNTYRVYITENYQYQFMDRYNIEDCILLLKMLILGDEINEKILIIEENKKVNCDIPVFLYMGDKKELFDFLEVYDVKYKKKLKNKK